MIVPQMRLQIILPPEPVLTSPKTAFSRTVDQRERVVLVVVVADEVGFAGEGEARAAEAGVRGFGVSGRGVSGVGLGNCWDLCGRTRVG